ncbi:hypothetical protein GO613_22905 [Azoarcus communis]|uniref:hypothetical protein n=1 Tax=Parazoarcus communis TaxID=41977 RepID=UPI001459EF75|nr:hypothetical protein [Parazoarcus communis]NMG50940.1 hypothetical protein [Parazoarcus communis]
MNVEEAYSQIANAIVEFCSGSRWDIAGSKTSIFSQMTQSNYWRQHGNEVIENDKFPSFSIGGEASRAALFLRNDLLKTTGQRIWGLTFTLFPDGKFRIEYNYDKPEGYEETDETLDVDLSSDIPGQSSVQ